MNWQEQLAAFRDQNPDLPEGSDIEPDPEPEFDPKCHPRLDVMIERKGRAGKTATIIRGWEVDTDQLLEFSSKIKQRLGAGGSVSGGEILIQGDRRSDVIDLLSAMGFKARKVGG